MAGRFVQRPRSCTTPARSSFAVAEEAGIDSIATYLWAIRNGHSNARPAVISAALIRAAADHRGAAVNLRRIAICEQSTDHMGSGTNVPELKARQLKDVAGSWDQASN